MFSRKIYFEYNPQSNVFSVMDDRGNYFDCGENTTIRNIYKNLVAIDKSVDEYGLPYREQKFNLERDSVAV